MMFGWVIGIILIIVLVVALGRGRIFQRNTGTITGIESNSSAMETLKNRYAKGEIDKEEFEEKKAELEKTK